MTTKNSVVYVLQLEDDCIYVGYTSHLKLRLNQHLNGKGSDWTKLHKPIKLIDVFYGGIKEEQVTARQYIREFGGMSKVRGGPYLTDDDVTNKHPSMEKSLTPDEVASLF